MPQIQIIAPTAQQQPERLRVAAYARVSSDSKDQLNSYASQIRYYTNYITAHENWDFVDIYADEGITGTRADKRDDFQRMMRDCRAHKIDTILVKSVSRFARNTQDCIEAVRELRSLGVTVIFEKEHLNTSTMANEMLLSMMSAFSQEESVSISKNMHKGATMRMQNGTYKTSTPAYGYRNGSDGKLVIVPEEAEVVRYIYERFLSGDGLAKIRKALHSKYKGDSQQKTFSENGILYILTNERYVGDQLLQKTYSDGQVPFCRKFNKGNLPQFFAQDIHEPIIERDRFLAVQDLLKKKRIQFQKNPPEKGISLSGKLHCAYCGNPLYRRTRPKGIEWTCYTHLQNTSACTLKPISDITLHHVFTRLYFKLNQEDCAILENYRSWIVRLKERVYFSQPETLILNRKLTDLLEQNHLLQKLQSKGCIDPAFYISQNQMLSQQVQNVQQQLKQHRESPIYTSFIQDTDSIIKAVSGALPDNYVDPLFPYISSITVSHTKLKIILINGMEFSESHLEEK